MIKNMIPKNSFLLIALLTLSVRVIFYLFGPPQYQTFGDAAEYLDTAKLLCSSGRYPFEHTVLPTFRAPGFPLFIAAISGCFYFSEWYLPLLLSIFDSISCLLGMGVVFRLSSSQKLLRSLLFGVAYAFYPPFVQQSISVQSEVVTQFALLAFYFMLAISTEDLTIKRRILYFFLAGIFVGVAILTRPSALVLLLMLLAGLVFGKAGSKLLTCSTMVGIVAVLLPWSTYATITTGKITIVNDSFCYSAYRGARLELLEVYNATDYLSYTEAAKKSEQVIREAETKIAPGEWCQATIDLLRQSPLQELKLAVLKLAVYFRPWPHQGAHSFWLVVVTGSIICLLFLLFFSVFWQKDKTGGIKWLALFFIVVVGLLHVPHQVSNRYRVPFVDPLMMIIAAAYLKPSSRRL